MLFNSFEFLIFFPVVITLYYLLPHRLRWALLLLASYVFYMFWRVDYALLLALSTLIDYACALMMGKHAEEQRQKRKPWLWFSMLSNLGILFTFKYFNFFAGAAQDLAQLLGVQYATPAFELLLPIGISFYTFQTMSYSIDVYYGRIKPEKHLGIFALFVTFFPQLVAGPIERAGNLLGQLRQRHEFNYRQVTDGLKLMAWGLFKKVVIADRLALMVNQVYGNPTDYEGLPLLIATVFFAFQIYCDFSGYSDMAIGAAQVMGFRLIENFRRPYFSKSVREFWSRWHISLSTWFRDYLYIPLGGNRVAKWRWYYNLFITFVVSGLWHGANWTFLVWGALHGFYLVLEAALATRRQANYSNENSLPKLQSLLRTLGTFALVCLGWVFFRAETLTDATYIITHNISGLGTSLHILLNRDHVLHHQYAYLGYSGSTFALTLLLLGLLLAVELVQSRISLRGRLAAAPVYVRWSVYNLAVVALVLLGIFSDTEFIYFQF
ncbi:MBOAT family protein [Pontibacter qinzhouensis]|uniref:MBOAT family protein n=1 Tax=Pontibacter qinzhouensis TaxID=2603253 RepID=A0A5C8J7G8_9BACT|nr:MBOAT family O-acyltransferase [Pontibacter qinzhouensis]TXK33885.1 MBOAT family protein [Pontibacter qinzhouensis]